MKEPGMDYREIGATGLRVSAICSGAMTWGRQNAEAQADGQMDYAIGVNFFDTAELSPHPVNARRPAAGIVCSATMEQLMVEFGREDMRITEEIAQEIDHIHEIDDINAYTYPSL
jgi:predicted aldo/keto reductase-like oxidoreductase